jgi:hypothetical protein
MKIPEPCFPIPVFLKGQMFPTPDRPTGDVPEFLFLHVISTGWPLSVSEINGTVLFL